MLAGMRAQTVDNGLRALMEKARAAQQSENFEEARRVYEEILKIRPRWGRAEFNLGLMYHLQKKYSDAVRLFNSALQHDTTVIAAYLFRGIAYYNAGQYDKALPSLQRYLKLQPDDREARFFLAGAYFALQDYANAARQYLEQIKIDPGREELYYRLGDCYLALVREEVTALRDDPGGRYFLWLISAEGHARQKDDQGAEPPIREALKLDPTAPEARISMGQLLLQRGQPRAAQEQFLQALQRSPYDCRALSGMADAELATGNTEASLEWLRPVPGIWPACFMETPVENLGLSPAEFDLRMKSLRIYASSPKWKVHATFQLSRLNGQAISGQCEPATGSQRDGTGAESQLLWASCLEARDDLRGATLALLEAQPVLVRDRKSLYYAIRITTRLAEKSVARLMSLAPGSHFVAMMHALLLEQQGNDKEAGEYYQRAISLGARDPDPLIEYARFKCKQNLFQEAILLLREAVKMDPYNIRARALLGEAYVSTEQPQTALPHLQFVVNANPRDKQSRIYLARSLAGLGHLKDAVAVLEAAPSDDDGRVHYVLGSYYRQQGRQLDAARALEVFEQRRKKDAR